MTGNNKTIRVGYYYMVIWLRCIKLAQNTSK